MLFVDINECEADGSEMVCPGDNRNCVNTEGSFSCNCNEGYIEEEDICIPKPKEGKSLFWIIFRVIPLKMSGWG